MNDRFRLFEGSKGAVAALVFFSTFYNALGIVSAIFMMQVYDRVMSSHSVSTLVVLCFITGFLFLVQGLLLSVRVRLLGRIGDRLLAKHEGVLLAESARRRLGAREKSEDNTPPSKDLETVSRAFKGNVVAALIDGPWAVIYLACLALVSPLLGMGAGLFVVALFAIAAFFAWFKVTPTGGIRQDELRAWDNAIAVETGRAAVALPQLAATVAGARNTSRLSRRPTIERESDARSSVMIVRNVGSSGVLAIGALLVITGSATIGIMMAATQLVFRILMPVEALIKEWRETRESVAAWRRLRSLTFTDDEVGSLKQEDIRGEPFVIKNLTVSRGSGVDPVLRGVSHTLQPGQVLLVAGSSGSGKSALLHALSGRAPLATGTLLFGSSRVQTVAEVDRERAFGLMPQEHVLYPGTVAQVIARFDASVPKADIVEAAKAAGLHDRISSHPLDYEARVLASGAPLPFGFAKRLQLARAICGRPYVLLLDDPVSGLEADALKAVTDIIASRRKEGLITVVVGFPPQLLAADDQILNLHDGKATIAGTIGEVFKTRPTAVKELAPAGGESARVS